jgi:nucleoside-diphosphate-sugar epimerase
MKTVIVTGGLGFIGSNLIKYLLKKGGLIKIKSKTILNSMAHAHILII